MTVFPSNLSSDDQWWQHTFLNRGQQVSSQVKQNKNTNISIHDMQQDKVRGGGWGGYNPLPSIIYFVRNVILCGIFHKNEHIGKNMLHVMHTSMIISNLSINNVMLYVCNVKARLCGCCILDMKQTVCCYILWLNVKTTCLISCKLRTHCSRFAGAIRQTQSWMLMFSFENLKKFVRIESNGRDLIMHPNEVTLSRNIPNTSASSTEPTT